MKPVSFVPTVEAISPERAAGVPGLEAAIGFWTAGERSAEEWFGEMDGRWGTAGFVLRRGEDVQAFVLYGPPEHLPRAGHYPLGPLGEDAALLAFVGGDDRARRRLLVRMLRDLRQRGIGTVEAITSDLGGAHHVPTAFLLESGWKPVRRAPYRLGLYTLARIELGSTVEVGELARSLVGKVKLPKLKGQMPGGLVSPARQHAGPCRAPLISTPTAFSTAPAGPLSTPASRAFS